MTQDALLGGKKAYQMPTSLTVIAIGGCGKKLVYGLCEHDWFLKEYLNKDRSLEIYVFDTDSSEKEGDTEFTKSVNSKVANMRDEMDGPAGKVTMEYYFLPDIASITYVSDLADPSIVKDVKAWGGTPRASFWWIHDEDKGFKFKDLKSIDPNVATDFGGGVQRRRAISKAIFYKILSQSSKKPFPSFSGNGEVAIVVGLGGGTGSGMFIDLARYIQNKSGAQRKIWLFGILPTVIEDPEEQLNAAVALSEMEYMHLTNEKIFHCCILSSLGPTGYNSGAEQSDPVVDYDQAFSYILINVFHLLAANKSSIFNLRNPYSGFIFADSHVYEYPVEELRTLKGEFDTVIVELGNLVESRKEIIKKVEELWGRIQDLYRNQLLPETKVEKTTVEDLAYVRAEIQNLEQIWDNEIPKLLKYQTQEKLSYIIRNVCLDDGAQNLGEINRYSTLIEYIKKLRHGVDQEEENVSEKNVSKIDEDDKDLYNHIAASLAQIEQLAEIQKNILQIEDRSIRDVLKKVLRGEEDLILSRRQVNEGRVSVRSQISDLESEKQEAGKRIDQISKQKEEANRKVILAVQDARETIEAYETRRRDLQMFQNKETELITEFSQLHQNLQGLADRLFSENRNNLEWEDWCAEVNYTKLCNYINEVSRSLSLSANLGYLSDVVEKLTRYYFYDYWVKAEKRNGWLRRNLGRAINTAPDVGILVKNRDSLLDSMKLTEKQNSKKIIVQESPLHITLLGEFITQDLEASLNTMRDEAINSMLVFLKLEGLNAGDCATVEAVFNRKDVQEIIKDMKRELTEIVNKTGRYDESIQNNQVKIESIDEGLKKLDQRKRMFDLVEQIVDETSKSRKLFKSHSKELMTSLSNIDKKHNAGDGIVSRRYRTLYKRVNPNVLSLVDEKAIGGKANMSALEKNNEGKGELDCILNLVEGGYRNLVDENLLGIMNRAIHHGDSQVMRWYFEKAALVISSPSPHMTQKILNHHSEISKTIKVDLSMGDKSNVTVEAHNYSRPWEIGLTLFCAASFFDNIAPLASGGGYWAKYQENKNNILHHALFLHTEEYIVRNNLLALEEAANFAGNELGSDDQMRETARRDLVDRLYTKKKVEEALPKREDTKEGIGSAPEYN